MKLNKNNKKNQSLLNQQPLTKSILQQAQSDIASFPNLKETKPENAPVPASKSQVDSLFSGWMTKTDKKKKHANNIGFVPAAPQILEPEVTRDGYLIFPFD